MTKDQTFLYIAFLNKENTEAGLTEGWYVKARRMKKQTDTSSV